MVVLFIVLLVILFRWAVMGVVLGGLIKKVLKENNGLDWFDKFEVGDSIFNITTWYLWTTNQWYNYLKKKT